MNDHEIRVALVLNGGVSLAVWMGGVVHELDLLRRASSGPGAPPPQPYDEEISRRWADLCHAGGQQRRVVVDVIAGTSAGGLNGSMLATAIAHGSTMDPPDNVRGPWLRQRWSALGGLEPGKLVPTSTSPKSVLDGDYFLGQLEDILGCLAGAGDAAAAAPVTLFVTASGLGRQQFQAQDAAGQRFDVPDHRYLLGFTSEDRTRYDGDGVTFSPVSANELADTALLARASRSSASFPAAFEPVLETPQMARRPPRVLPAWPHSPSWLVDGGVLDNAPFGPVLDVVARRPVATRATRYVLYVVPSSGVGAASTQVRPAEQPSWRTATLSALQFPREVDFRSDVEQLERLLMDADASWSDAQRVFDRSVADPVERQRLLQAADLLRPAYVRGRAAGGVWEALTLSTGKASTVLDATSALSEADVDAVIAAGPLWVASRVASVQTVVPGGPLPFWPWGTGPAERVVRLVLRGLRSRIEEPTDDAEPAALTASLDQVSQILQRVIAVRDAVSAALAVAELDPHEGAVAVTGGVNQVFERLDVQAALGGQIAELQAVVPPEQVLTALAVEIVSRCTSARTPPQRSAPFQFVRLGPDVALPLLADGESGTLAAMLADRVLYGTQVGHFGAFGAAEWREWDWLMGRLHGVAHLGHLLGADEEWIRETQELVLVAEGSTREAVDARIRRLSEDFPPGGGGAAVRAMRDELNATDRGRTVLRSLVERLVAVSDGVTPRFGTWAKAVIAADQQPPPGYLRSVRWLTEPARGVFWRGIVSGVPQQPTSAPALGTLLPAVGALVLTLVLMVLASVVEARPAAVVLAVAAGVTLSALLVLMLVRYVLNRVRATLKARLLTVLPPAPEQ